MTAELNQSEIDKKLEKVVELVTKAQEVNDRKGAKDAEQINKMTTDLTGVMQTLQEVKQAQKAQEKVSEIIEKQVLRMGNGTSTGAEADVKSQAKDEMTRYMRKGIAMSPELVEDISRVYADKILIGSTDSEREQFSKTLLVGQDPQGGYWVRPELSNIMVTRIFETSPIRTVANTVTTGSDGIEMIIDDNEMTSGGWVGETSVRSDTATANIGMLNIKAFEQYAQPKVTQKMLDDAGFDVEAWVMGKVTDKLTRTENTAFVIGQNPQQPRGFLTYPAWAVPTAQTSAGITTGVYERFKIEQIALGAATQATADGVVLMHTALLEDYRPNAAWLMQRSTFQGLITLKDSIGQYLLNPEVLARDTNKILLGSPVVFASDMPAVAASALPIAYGDFTKGYTIVDRIGFRVIRDNLTSKPYVLFYVTKRTGGDVTNYQSIKIGKISV